MLAKYLPETMISRRGDYASFLIPDALMGKPLAKRSNPQAIPEEVMPENFKSSVIELIQILIFSSSPSWKMQLGFPVSVRERFSASWKNWE
jgi:hypothetical protein